MTDIEKVPVTVLTPDVQEAHARADRIRVSMTDFSATVLEAYHAGDHRTLGYKSWDDYCATEYGGTIAIPRGQRGDIVFTLRDGGMSTRAISAVTGVSHQTVGRELAGGPSGPAVPAEPPDPGPLTVLGTAVDALLEDDLGKFNEIMGTLPAPSPVVGIDGKKYPLSLVRHTPRSPRRSPLADDFRDAIHKMEKLAQRLERLTDDDRFTRYRKDGGDYDYNRLKTVAEILNTVTGRMVGYK